MELVNGTPYQTGYTIATRPDGRELLVVLVKGTFIIPEAGMPVVLAEDQVPLVETDVFTGDPGFSAPLYENEFAPSKPSCDVLLVGSAYAPHGQPTKRVHVSLQVDGWTKSFEVVGHRVWQSSLGQLGPSEPEPFVTVPISYNNAFGGVDRLGKVEAEYTYFLKNPVGLGYCESMDIELLEGQSLPNTEEIDAPITTTYRKYRPMSFGVIGRSWQQRIKYAGTYDTTWLEQKFPFLPDDFQNNYFLSAPEDQQIPYIKGKEQVRMTNLTSDGLRMFDLPTISDPCTFFFKDGRERRIRGVVDTFVLEPDLGRFSLTSRISLPLQRSHHEISRVIVGQTKPERVHVDGAVEEYWGKPYYKSLSDLIAAHRARPPRQ